MLALLLLMAGFLLTILTAFVSFRDKHLEYRKGQTGSMTYRTVFIVAICAAFITLAANLVANEEKRQGSINARKLTDSLIVLNESVKRAEELNLMLLLEQKDSTNQVLSLQQKLIKSGIALNDANRQIIGMQHSVIRHIADTSNFPRLQIARVGNDQYYHTLTVLLNNTGESPFRNLHAKYYDMYGDVTFNRERKRYETVNSHDTLLLFEHVTQMEKDVTIGDVPRHSGRTILYLRMPKPAEAFGYNIVFTWDNGSMAVYFQGTFKQPNDHLTFKLISLTDSRNRNLPKDLITFTAFNRDGNGKMMP